MAQAQRSFVRILFVACLLCTGADARAAQQLSAREHCQADALEKWYCATDPLGTAVVDKLGRVLCAPGACVKQPNEDKDKEDWLCSSVPGGMAGAAPEGPPVCDGKCQPPETTACKKR